MTEKVVLQPQKLARVRSGKLADSQQPQEHPGNLNRSSPAGDQVLGDKYSVGNIIDSIVAIGPQAQVTVNYLQAPTTPGIWFGVPALPTHLIGRKKLIDNIVEQLLGGGIRLIAIEGLPGVGKTTLATAVAHQAEILAKFKDGVLWAGLGPEATAAEAMNILNQWAIVLGMDTAAKAGVEERKQAVAGVIGRRAMLIVIDDVWDIEVAKLLQFDNPHCCHLLTTRDMGLARQFAGSTGTVSLPVLQEDVAFQLLQSLAAEACAADPQAAKSLVQALGGLPLAIELLGSYLAVPERSLLPELSQKSLAEMKDPSRRLQLAKERLGAPGQTVTLQDTIALSLAGLREFENGAQAERAFYALGVFAPQPARFTVDAAVALAGVEVKILAILVSRNLLQLAGDQLAMHQVIYHVARLKVDDALIARHRRYYLSLVNENRQYWQRIEASYGQLKWAWESVTADEDLLELVQALEFFHRRRGLWQDLGAWSRRGWQAAQRLARHEQEGILLTNMGEACFRLSEWDKALEYNNQALVIHQETGNRAKEAVTLNLLGNVLINMGEIEQALAYHKQALPIAKEFSDSHDVVKTLNNIGIVYVNLGHLEKGLTHYAEALQIAQETGDQASVAETLVSMGNVYVHRRSMFFNRRNYHKALEHYNQALAIQKEIGDRPGQAVTLLDIGVIYFILRQRDEALAYYNQALTIHEKLGERNVQAITLSNIGLIFLSLRQPQDALEQFNKSLAIFAELGNRVMQAFALSNIGQAYNNLGLPAEALDYYDEALDLGEEVDNLPVQIATLARKSRTYFSQLYFGEGFVTLARMYKRGGKPMFFGGPIKRKL